MWHVAPWGNRARRSVPTARQTKCVCLRSWASLLCVHRHDREKRRSMIAALWLGGFVSWDVLFIYLLLFFYYFFLFSPRLWIIRRASDFLISPFLSDETGGPLPVVSHAVTKTESCVLGGAGKENNIRPLSGVSGAVAYISWGKRLRWVPAFSPATVHCSMLHVGRRN